jgi:hypothetical protein
MPGKLFVATYIAFSSCKVGNLQMSTSGRVDIVSENVFSLLILTLFSMIVVYSTCLLSISLPISTSLSKVPSV